MPLRRLPSPGRPKFELLPVDPERPDFLRWKLIRGHVVLPETRQHVFASMEVSCHREIFWSGALGSLSWRYS